MPAAEVPQKFDWKQMLKDIAPGLGTLFGQGMGLGREDNWQNPADAAMPYLQQIPGQMHDQYDPYVNAGQSALPTMQNQYNSLINYPGAKMNAICQSYHKSPGFYFELQKALEAGKHAAAAGGMAGSPMHEYQAMQTATGLANQDFNQWLSQALGMYGKGLGGEESLYGTGANASNNLAQMIAQTLASQGETAFYGADAYNKHNDQLNKDEGSFFGTLGGIAAKALPFFIP